MVFAGMTLNDRVLHYFFMSLGCPKTQVAMEHLQGAEIIYRLNLDIPLVCGIHDSEIHSKHRFTMVHMGLFEHGVSTNLMVSH